jgi:hypothetical protein
LKGYRLELNVKRALGRAGFFVFRGAGSKPIDLIAIKRRPSGVDVVLVECKADLDADPEKVCRTVFNTYQVPSVAVVKRGGTMWEWCLMDKGVRVGEETLAALRSALGPIYRVISE